MSNEPRPEPDLAEPEPDQAARNTLALTPLVGLRSEDLLAGAATVLNSDTNPPTIETHQRVCFHAQAGKIATGKSARRRQAGKRRCADGVWKSSNLHRGLIHAYLALASGVETCVGHSSPSEIGKARARLLTRS